MPFQMVLVVVLPKVKKVVWKNSTQSTNYLDDTEQIIYPIRDSISLTIKIKGLD